MVTKFSVICLHSDGTAVPVSTHLSRNSGEQRRRKMKETRCVVKSGLPRGEPGPEAYNCIFLRSTKYDCPLGLWSCSCLEPHSPRDRWRGGISASVPSAPGFPPSLFRGPCGPRAPCFACGPWPVGTPSLLWSVCLVQLHTAPGAPPHSAKAGPFAILAYQACFRSGYSHIPLRLSPLGRPTHGGRSCHVKGYRK